MTMSIGFSFRPMSFSLLDSVSYSDSFGRISSSYETRSEILLRSRVKKAQKEEIMRKEIVSFCTTRIPSVGIPVDLNTAFYLRAFVELRPMEKMKVLFEISTTEYFLLFHRRLPNDMLKQYRSIASDLVSTHGYFKTKPNHIIAECIKEISCNPNERLLQQALKETEKALIKEKEEEIQKMLSEKQALEEAIQKATLKKQELEESQKQRETYQAK
jgi:hypothetical protein